MSWKQSGELGGWDPFEERFHEMHFIEDFEKRAAMPTVGYIAHFEYINGFEKTLYWTADQMMSHADKYSPAFSAAAYKKLLNGEIPQEDMWKYSSFWYRDFDSMAKKTMLRQLISKWGIMTVEMTTAYERDGRVMVPNSADDGLLPETPDFADAGQNGLGEQNPPKIERTAKTMDLPEPEADEVKAAVDLAGTLMVKYNIISTGSDGNATILEEFVLIDCGVPYKALEPYVPKLKLVLLTHIHSDHFQKRTIKRLAEERPTLRFGCCRWLAPPLLAAGVPERQIDVLEPRTMYGYGLCNVIPFMLTHNVPNCGYKVHFPSGKVIYATDTNNLNGVQALGYDLYLIEANYRDEDIQAKIAEKKAAGQYAYEMQVLKNHLSEAKCNDFLVRNMQANSVYIPMHVHVDKEKTDGRNGEN